MANRILGAVVLTAFCSGCFSTTRYTLAEVEQRGLSNGRGSLEVTTTNGKVQAFSAPYVAAATRDLLAVKPQWLPGGAFFEADTVEHLDERAFSPARTTLLTTGIIASIAAYAGFGVLAAISYSRASANQWSSFFKWP